MKSPSNYINLILSPHLDDAVLSLGGLISKENTHTKIINVFSGIPETPVSTYWDRICGFSNSTIAMNTRLQEDKIALSMLGISESSIQYFSYLDYQYRKDNAQHNSTEIKKQIGLEIERYLQKYSKQNIHLFVPMNISHTDHRIVRDAIIDVYEEATFDKNKFSLYFYQDMPYTFRVFLSKRLLSPFKQKSSIVDSLCPRDVPPTVREFIKLNNRDFSIKEKSIKQYPSQLKAIFSDIYFIFQIERYFSREQVKIFRLKSPHCEVVYRVL